ncbi:MAG: molecular chaperone DnaJ, partial [Candidatus Chloroheliales bacterium]
HIDWPVNVAQAALGDELELPTLEPGGITYIKQHIAPGTQHDKVIRLRDKGIPYLRQTGRGDLHVHLKVQVPTALSDEQRDLFDKLARSFGHEVNPQGDKGFLGRIKDVLGG